MMKSLNCSWRKVSWLSNVLQEPALCSVQGLDALIASDAAKSLKSDRTTTVVMMLVNRRPLVIKRYNDRDLWHIFKKAFRQTRARRCWLMSERFRHAGLNVAEPIAFLEKRYGPIRRQSYFISNFLAGKILLDSISSLNQTQKIAVKKEVQKAFAIMKLHKITHGDLKASNLIWFEEKIYFIDLDAAKSHRLVWSWARAHEKDKKRFMKNWRSQPELMEFFSDIGGG